MDYTMTINVAVRNIINFRCCNAPQFGPVYNRNHEIDNLGFALYYSTSKGSSKKKGRTAIMIPKWFVRM